MAGGQIFILVLIIGISCGSEDSQGSRSTRTISRFFGGVDASPQPQPQAASPQQPPAQVAAAQQRKPVPLIYSVKYYDRTGEGEKADVAVPDPGIIQDGVPGRVFLNLYGGQQQTPVYYDNKGQILVPCPVYDHLYVAGLDQRLVQKPAPPPPSKLVQTAVVPVPPPVPLPHAHLQPEFVYYAAPSYLGHTHTHNPVYKQNPGLGQLGHGVTVVGSPFEYPFYPGVYPYGSQGYNPYLFIKPTPPGHHHGPSPTVQIQQPVPVTVAQLLDKKEGDKLD